jgi:hypothetical protein
MITRKLREVEDRKLKVERTFNIPPRLANFFSVAAREPPIKIPALPRAMATTEIVRPLSGPTFGWHYKFDSRSRTYCEREGDLLLPLSKTF